MALEEPQTPHPVEERLAELAEMRAQALHAGSESAVERQHARGKLTARERIDQFLDPGTFVELDMPGPVARLDRTPGAVECAGRALGADTDAVLAEVLAESPRRVRHRRGDTSRPEEASE